MSSSALPPLGSTEPARPSFDLIPSASLAAVPPSSSSTAPSPASVPSLGEPPRPLFDLIPSAPSPDPDVWSTVQRAAAYDPELASEAKTLGLDLQRPAPVVAWDIQQARDLWNRRKERTLLRQSPAVRDALTNPVDLAEARDALEPLGYFEKLARQYEAGKLNAQIGLLSHRLAAAERGPKPNPATETVPQLLDRLVDGPEALEREIAPRERRLAAIERPLGWFDWLQGVANFAGLLTQTVPEVARDAAVGASIGFGVAAEGGPLALASATVGAGRGAAFGIFDVMRKVEGGATYRTLRQAGVDQETAYRASTIAGWAKGSLELVGGSRLVGGALSRLVATKIAERVAAAPVRAAIKEGLAGLAGEAVTEVAQEGVDVGLESLVGVDPGRNQSVTQRLLDAGAGAIASSALLSGFGGVGVYYAEAKAIAKGMQAQPLLDAMGQPNAMRERAPEAHAKVVQAVGDATGNSHVFLPAEVLRQLGDQLPPDLQKPTSDALATGADVAVPIGQYDQLVSEPERAKVLRPHAKLAADARSQEQIKQFEAQRDQLLEQAAGAVEREFTERKAFAAAAQKVESEVYAKFVSAGGIPREAKAAAALHRAFVETMARATGVSPWQFHQGHGLNVAAAPADPAAAAAPAEALSAQDRGYFVPSELLIVLRKTLDPKQGANASTLIHELGHYFLTVYGRVANQENAPLSVAENMQTLLESFGVKDRATWNAMTLAEQREHHEAFAYNFEKYALDGKAPTERLKKLFRTFRAFLRRVYGALAGQIDANYRDETGKPLPTLTPEVRGVFDAMLGAQDAVSMRGPTPMFESAEQGGMTPEQWVAYQERVESALEGAEQELGEKGVRVWRGAIDLVRGEKREEQQRRHEALKREVKRVRAEVAKELLQQPVYKATEFLQTGRLVDENGNAARAENHKVDRKDVDRVFPDPQDPARETLRLMSKKGGLSADAIALVTGFDTGKEMLEAIAAAPTFAEAVDLATNERMAEAGVDATAAEAPAAVREEDIERAVHGDPRVQMLAAELQHLEGGLKAEHGLQERIRLAKAAAEKIVQGTRLRDLLPQRAIAAAARLGRDAIAAVQAGNTSRAILLKQQQLLQTVLVRAIIDAKRDVQRARERFDERYSQKDKDLADRYEVDLVGAGRAILGAFKLGEQPDGARPHLENVREYDPETYQAMLPVVGSLQQLALEASQRGSAPLPYANLTVDEFAMVTEGLDALWDQARRQKLARREGKLVEIKQLIDDALDGRDDLPDETQPMPRQTQTDLQKKRVRAASIVSSFRRFESFVIQLDGGQPGKLHKLLVQELRASYDRYGVEMNDVVKQQRQVFDQLDLPAGQIKATELQGFIFRDKAQLLGAIAHAGTESNLAAMLLGLDMVPPTRVDAVDFRPWQTFVQRMVDEGVLTKQDLDAIQGLRDVFEARKARAQRELKDGSGYRMEELPPMETVVRFPDGKTVAYRGGYLPAKVDFTEAKARGLNVPVAALQATVEVVKESRGALPSTMARFMVSRTGAVLPRVLDLNHLLMALDEHLRFIHLENLGRDVMRIVRHPKMLRFLTSKDPAAVSEIVFPWIEGTLQNQVVRPGGLPQLDWVWKALRRNVVSAAMFANMPNALQQTTGIAQVLTMVPLPFVRAAAAKLARHPFETVSEVAAAEDFMRLRLQEQVSGIIDDAESVLGTAVNRFTEWTQKHSLFLQRMTQNRVDVIAWLSARDHALAEGKSEADAAQHANAVVRTTQGSGTAADLAKVERQTPFVRLFTVFSSYFIGQLNLIASRPTLGQRATAAANSILFAGIVGSAIGMALRGGWDDDDHDGALWDDVVGWTFRESLNTSAATFLPVVGPIATKLFDRKQSAGRALGPVVTAIERARNAADVLGPGELRSRQLTDVATALTLLTGFPFVAVSRPAAYVLDVQQGRTRPGEGVLPAPLDVARGLLTGR